MSSMLLPKKLKYNSMTRALCARIGVSFNGQPRPNDVLAYDVDAGTITTMSGETLRGVVEPYWKH